MQISSDPRVAWLTGFYEGEGCISASIRHREGITRQRQIYMGFSQKDTEPLLLTKDLLIQLDIPEDKIGIYVNKRTGVSLLQVNKFEVVNDLAMLLWDGLSERRQAQIRSALYLYCKVFKPALVSNGKVAVECRSELLEIP